MIAHPCEAVARARQRLDLRRFSGDLRLDYGPVEDWEAELHRQLGLPSACDGRNDFHDLYEGLRQFLTDFPNHHDADPSLAKAIWCIACHTGPEKVVETGVARGVSSRFVLEGLARTGSGHLWSIDLPPLLTGFHGAVGAAVPDELRNRWTYVRGSSRRQLPRVFDAVAPIDFFIQDSVGTRPTVLLELDLAWQALRPHGWLVVNAINRSEAFQDFLERHAPSWFVVGRAGVKSRLGNPAEQIVGQFAVCIKEGPHVSPAPAVRGKHADLKRDEDDHARPDLGRCTARQRLVLSQGNPSTCRPSVMG